MTRVLAFALLLFLAPDALAQAGDLRIYRCTDATGKQTLRDTPCPKGQEQQVREMLRPQDPPTPRASKQPAAVPAMRERQATRYVVLAPPRAMYECTDPDGKRYTSANDDGNPRWVPLWTLGYPVVRPRTSLGSNIGGPANPRAGGPLPPMRDINWPVATGGGQWIRDTCVMLPPAETCARLRDRRAEIRTRFFNAMPSERDVLRLEERGINARLDNDCGVR